MHARSRIVGAIVAVHSICVGAAWGADLPVVFEFATNRVKDGDIKLANGAKAESKDWRTLLVAALPGSEGSCTASLVGESVLLLAAHCLDREPKTGMRKASIRLDEGQVELTCEMHPDYVSRPYMYGTPRSSSDYALCFMDHRGNVPKSLSTMEFEVIDATPLKSGDGVVMMGYGCSAISIVNGNLVPAKDFGTLRIGNAVISGRYNVPPFQTYMRIRSRPQEDPALCPGDSGGPVLSGITADTPTGRRRIRAVNSMIEAEKQGAGYVVVNDVSPLAETSFVAWIKAWLQRNGGYVCGINRSAGQIPCRD